MSRYMIRIWAQNCRYECLRKEGRQTGRSKVCQWTQTLMRSREKATGAREGVRQLRNISVWGQMNFCVNNKISTNYRRLL